MLATILSLFPGLDQAPATPKPLDELDQPNQEDLVDLLARGDEERIEVLTALTINLSAPQAHP